MMILFIILFHQLKASVAPIVTLREAFGFSWHFHFDQSVQNKYKPFRVEVLRKGDSSPSERIHRIAPLVAIVQDNIPKQCRYKSAQIFGKHFPLVNRLPLSSNICDRVRHEFVRIESLTEGCPDLKIEMTGNPVWTQPLFWRSGIYRHAIFSRYFIAQVVVMSEYTSDMDNAFKVKPMSRVIFEREKTLEQIEHAVKNAGMKIQHYDLMASVEPHVWEMLDMQGFGLDPRHVWARTSAYGGGNCHTFTSLVCEELDK